MATMNISLPDEMKAFVEERVESGRYANASDFMRDLVRREMAERDRVFAEIRALGGRRAWRAVQRSRTPEQIRRSRKGSR